MLGKNRESLFISAVSANFTIKAEALTTTRTWTLSLRIALKYLIPAPLTI